MKTNYLFLLLSVLMLCTGCHNNEPETVSLSCEDTEISTTEETTILYQTSLKEMEITEDLFTITGGNIDIIDDAVLFSSDKEGTFKVYIDTDDFTSNTITINVVKPKDTQNSSDESSNKNPDVVKGDDNTYHNAPMSVDKLKESADYLYETKSQVWVQGDFPQSAMPDDEGNYHPVLWNDSHTDYIYLILNDDISFGGCRVYIYGTLSFDGTNYSINVDSIEQVD